MERPWPSTAVYALLSSPTSPTLCLCSACGSLGIKTNLVSSRVPPFSYDSFVPNHPSFLAIVSYRLQCYTPVWTRAVAAGRTLHVIVVAGRLRRRQGIPWIQNGKNGELTGTRRQLSAPGLMARAPGSSGSPFRIRSGALPLTWSSRCGMPMKESLNLCFPFVTPR